MQTILTIKYGNKFSADSVNDIYEKTNGKYNYVCLTDDPTDIDPAIETRPRYRNKTARPRVWALE